MFEELKKINYAEFRTESWKKAVEDRQSRLEYAAGLKVPHIHELVPHTGLCAVVGAAPSIANHLDELKELAKDENNLIISLNGAHEWLITHGLVPRIHILFEVDTEKAEDSCGGSPHKDVYYYVCSHCMPSVFEGLEGYHTVLWHCFDEPPAYQGLVHQLFPGEFMIGGGFVTFFRALNIATVLGFRNFELYGCDCSFEGKNTHYDGYHSQNIEPILVVAAGTVANHKVFKTTPTLSFMASEFIRFCDAKRGFLHIKVMGSGLLRCLHENEFPEPYLTSNP